MNLGGVLRRWYADSFKEVFHQVADKLVVVLDGPPCVCADSQQGLLQSVYKLAASFAALLVYTGTAQQKVFRQAAIQARDKPVRPSVHMCGQPIKGFSRGGRNKLTINVFLQRMSDG
jgi:hypothetical protein